MSKNNHISARNTDIFRQQGLSLVEIMVAMVISLVLLGGAMTVLMRSKDSYRVSEDLSRLQDNLRIASEMITRDLRMTGFVGCARYTLITNVLNSSAVGSYYNMNYVLEGVEGGTPANSPWEPSDATALATTAVGGYVVKAETDAITIRSLGSGAGIPLSDASVPTVVPMATGASPIKVRLPLLAGETIAVGSIMALFDCTTTHIFQVTAFDATTGEVSHTDAAGFTPGNSTGDLGKAYTTGRLTPINNVRYFVANNTDGNPSLYRQYFEPGTAATGSLDIQELVPGIESMQILYGEDTTANKVANKYVAANSAIWDNVVSVRFGLLGRTIDLYGSETDSNTYDVNGFDFNAPGDRRARKVLTTSVSLRNLQ